MKKCISLVLVFTIGFNGVSCDKMKSVGETAKSYASAAGDAIISAKDSVVDWFSNIDFSRFKDGWDKAKSFVGTRYTAVVSSEYISNVSAEIANLKTDINMSMGSLRTKASEAGFVAEKWVTDTFNIDAAAKGSNNRAYRLDSNGLGSVDVETTYEENASLKYYQTAQGSANAQATKIVKSYYEYCRGKESPMTLREYLDTQGFDCSELEALYKSLYEGQTRIIPSDQIAEAKAYLQGKADSVLTDSQVYKETLDHLKDRLESPDGVKSRPLSYEEAQAITELAIAGEFSPEQFNIKLSNVLSPKYVLKQAIGTGLTMATLGTVLSIGPDLFSVIVEAIKTNGIDEKKLEKIGIGAAISGAEGFVEGSMSHIMTTLCQGGVFGEALTQASPTIVATMTIVAIECVINAYSLAIGDMTIDEYGNNMAENVCISLLAIPTTALLLAALPSLKLVMLAGGIAGSMIACVGYTIAKEIVLDIVDGGGFEAFLPPEVADALSVAKSTISSINIVDSLSAVGDTILSTAEDGFIWIKSKFD